MESGDHRTVLHGRGAECAQLREILAGARAGESGTLVIRGDPGVGKSALLNFVAEQASGMEVLQMRASEAEADLAFAGLFALLRPILGKLDRIANPQGRALAGALGLAEAQSTDRFLVSAGALGLLAAAADEAPLCCLVDDAQWLDQPSAEALVFVARRLGADCVALLFAASDWGGRRFEAADVRELTLEGVDRQSAERILDETARDLAPHVRERLLAEATGNPLALRELPGGLNQEERLGRTPLSEQIALTPRLRALFGRRIQRLPTDTRDALLVCALDGTGDAGAILRAAAQLGLAADSLEPAETDGLIRVADDGIGFAHPLVRASVIEAAPLAKRQLVHAAFAATLTAAEHVDRRVWHQAITAVTGDDAVADALEQSALRAQERGGHSTAAIAFQRAAELTQDEGRQGLRLASAAEAAWSAGEADRARGFVEGALQHAHSGSLRARLLHLRGLIESAEGRYREAAETLSAAARESTDPSRTLAISVDAAYSVIGADFRDELVLALAQQAEALPTISPTDEFNRHVVLWLGRQFAGQFDAARVHHREVLRLADRLEEDPLAQYWAAVLTGFMFGNGEPALPYARRAVQIARKHGYVGLLPDLLAALALQLCWSSQFGSAYATADEGAKLARDLGQNAALNLLTLACVEAIRGQEELARTHAEQAGEHGFINIRSATTGVLGLLELTHGRPGVAAEVLLETLPSRRLDSIEVMTIPDLIEALARTGRAAECRPLLDRLRGARFMTERFRNSLVARCEGLLETRSPAEAFQEALDLADALPPFERARTELLYGEWLRRSRLRRESRAHLRAAADEFRRLGAAPWAARAESELRATGETVRRRDPSTLEELTPQELQVAGLVAEGLTNKEIASQLFLSSRTVEYHLRKVFTKLGITARSELIRRGSAPSNTV